MNRLWQMMTLLGIAVFASALLYFVFKYDIVVPVLGQEIDLQEEEKVEVVSDILVEAKLPEYSSDCVKVLEEAGTREHTFDEVQRIIGCYNTFFAKAPVVVEDVGVVEDIKWQDYAKWGAEVSTKEMTDTKTMKGKILIKNDKTFSEVKEAITELTKDEK